MDFFTGGSIIMDYVILARSDGWKLKKRVFFLHMVLIDWTGVVWINVMFLSAVWTVILTAPIHCRSFINEQVS